MLAWLRPLCCLLESGVLTSAVAVEGASADDGTLRLVVTTGIDSALLCAKSCSRLHTLGDSRISEMPDRLLALIVHSKKFRAFDECLPSVSIEVEIEVRTLSAHIVQGQVVSDTTLPAFLLCSHGVLGNPLVDGLQR